MKAAILTRLRPTATQGAMNRATAFLLAPVLMATAGCVQVSAPNEPIEINLNINIRQEVVVRLQEDVRDLIEKNPGVF
ncbi:MAG: YnbE family lipoprotein [Allosphingosinicella sp.]